MTNMHEDHCRPEFGCTKCADESSNVAGPDKPNVDRWQVRRRRPNLRKKEVASGAGDVPKKSELEEEGLVRLVMETSDRFGDRFNVNWVRKNWLEKSPNWQMASKSEMFLERETAVGQRQKWRGVGFSLHEHSMHCLFKSSSLRTTTTDTGEKF